MLNHDLKPGCMAQMLPWHPIPNAIMQLVQVTGVPRAVEVTVKATGARINLHACPIDRCPVPEEVATPGTIYWWPAHLLVPLPPDDEAYKLFSDNIVTVTIPNLHYKERA